MSLSSIDLGALLPPGLPSGTELVAEGRRLAREVELGSTLYLEQKGVRAEIEYRRRAAAEGIPCTTINLGLATWRETREALELIYEDAQRRGVRPPDRFNLLAERRMGLPPELRADAPAETGPCLWTEQDWWELGHTVPIQPEAGDNMIGGPASVPNAMMALRAGSTTVGVASQFVWRWPYWDDEPAQMAAVVTAAAILAAKRDQGACLNGYIDDSYPGVFSDYASLVGWAMFERYVFEQLVGVPYSVSWGGLTTDPMHKAAVTMALAEVNPDRVPPAYINGDTISHSEDPEGNYAGVSTDLLLQKVVCVHYGIAAGLIAVPVTETTRIPSWQEVADVHTVNRRLESYLPSIDRMIDWPRLERERDRLVEGGLRVFTGLLEAMRATGVDERDPLQVLIVLRRLGSDPFERLFGAGEADEAELSGRRALLQTDLVSRTIQQRDDALREVLESLGSSALTDRKIVVASSDVHHFALFMLRSVLEQAGADVIDIGVSRDPEDIVKVVIETAADAVAITTHNGVARSFGIALAQQLEAAGSPAPIFMGGVLNEDVPESPTPIDVRPTLWEAGITTPDSMPSLISELQAAG